jgi:Protein of unknown function (DUF402)
LAAVAWRFGDVIARRDLWRGIPWVGTAAIVIQDEPELLAVYVAEGAEIAVLDGDSYPIAHPWRGKRAWAGHGIVILSRPGDAYSVWLFWEGPRREFAGWYLNLEEPLRRTPHGYDTRDHELDLWSEDGREWHFKDAERMEQRVDEGVYTAEEAAAIEAEGARLHSEVSGGGGWWDDSWADWKPPAEWQPPKLPADWARRFESK